MHKILPHYIAFRRILWKIQSATYKKSHLEQNYIIVYAINLISKYGKIVIFLTLCLWHLEPWIITNTVLSSIYIKGTDYEPIGWLRNHKTAKATSEGTMALLLKQRPGGYKNRPKKPVV